MSAEAAEEPSSASYSAASRISINSDEASSAAPAGTGTDPSVMSVDTNGSMHPRRSFNRTQNSTHSTNVAEKSDQSVSRYTVDTSRMTVRSDCPEPWGPSLSQWEPTSSETPDTSLAPVLQSTQLSGNTSAGVPSLPSDYLHDSENYGTHSKHSTIEPASSDATEPGSDPSGPPMSSRDDSALRSEMGPHPEHDVTDRLLDNSEVIYNERQGLAQLARLPSTQWLSGHLSGTFRSSSHRLVTVRPYLL